MMALGAQGGDQFKIRRGTNISHWLSQSKKRGAAREAWFQKEDVKYLAELGFDHLRIPIDEEQMWDESGKPHVEAFELLNNCLDWCEEYDLRAIVDLHVLRSHHFNGKERPLWTGSAEQKKFLQLWRDLSGFLRERPDDLVAYELLNEPVADDHEEWNQLVSRAIKVLRKEEPKRTLFVGSNMWQQADTFRFLRIPENDPYLILSVHMYEPFALTHYKAPWIDHLRDYTGPVQYPGSTIPTDSLASLSGEQREMLEKHVEPYNKDAMEQHLQEPIRLAKAYGLKICCTEWGCLPTVPREDRLRWYRDLRQVMEGNDIAWSTWDYKGSFGIRNGKTGEPDSELIDTLLN